MTPELKLRVQPANAGSAHATGTAPARDAAEKLDSPVGQAVDRATRYLLGAQNREGYWWAELEADTTLESDYILYLHILGQLYSEKTPKLAKYIRERQLPDGGWNIFYGGPAELNATVKAYVALRLAGDSAVGAAHGNARDAKFTNWAAWKRRIPTCGFIWRWWARSIGAWYRRFLRS